jgi:hypothetical protein
LFSSNFLISIPISESESESNRKNQAIPKEFIVLILFPKRKEEGGRRRKEKEEGATTKSVQKTISIPSQKIVWDWFNHENSWKS